MNAFNPIKAVVFDTFGTVVDWRGSIAKEGKIWGRERGIDIDWGKLADAWRDEYRPSMNRVRTGELAWTKLDDLHRMSLGGLLKKFGISGLSDDDKEHLVHMWHRVKPWPDSVEGLTRLKQKFIISPFGNANVVLFANMAKHNGLPWDLILSAEQAKHYKPDTEMYLMALEHLSLQPHELMLVAAHSYDLQAAQKLGIRTGFIYRPHEFGDDIAKADTAKPGEFDIVTDSIGKLATQLGCPAPTFEVGGAQSAPDNRPG